MTAITFIMIALTVTAVIYEKLFPGQLFFQLEWVGIALSVIFGAFCIIQLACLFNTKFSVAKIGFHIFHFGLILFLIASFMFFVAGAKSYFTLQVGTIYNSKVQFEELGEVDLGFGLQVKSLQVSKYPEDENGNAADKFINTQIVIYPNDESEPREHLLYINGPHTENGYKIYLMDYDRASYENGTEQSVTILIKKNPGEIPSVIAIAMMIIGSFIMAFGKKSAPSLKAKGGKRSNANT